MNKKRRLKGDMERIRLAIVGSGALGSIIARAIVKDLREDFELVGILSGRYENALKLADEVNTKAYRDLDEVLEERPDYIIEAAGPAVVKEMGEKILAKGINLIVLSVGAFADESFYKAMASLARENNCRVHLTSGAVGGFDVLSSAMLMEEGRVQILTEKAPKSLVGAPYLEGKELSEVEAVDVFTGTAKEAIEAFPKNINVAVATALASAGVDKTKVTIRSVPELKSNRHTIKFQGDRVRVAVQIESRPSADNPKSSTLAAWSVVSLLKRLVSPISF